MSHTPPAPEASIAPFPAHPAPHTHDAAPMPKAQTPKATPAGEDRSRLITGAAVGIGSAAIVAALLYVNRKPGKVPKPGTPRA